jgi:hypothetical protein
VEAARCLEVVKCEVVEVDNDLVNPVDVNSEVEGVVDGELESVPVDMAVLPVVVGLSGF